MIILFKCGDMGCGWCSSTSLSVHWERWSSRLVQLRWAVRAVKVLWMGAWSRSRAEHAVFVNQVGGKR